MNNLTFVEIKSDAAWKCNREGSKTRRHFGVSREIYYKWKRDYENDGEETLINSKP